MKELAKQYDPSQVEDRIYQFWLDGGYSLLRKNIGQIFSMFATF